MPKAQDHFQSLETTHLDYAHSSNVNIFIELATVTKDTENYQHSTGSNFALFVCKYVLQAHDLKNKHKNTRLTACNSLLCS